MKYIIKPIQLARLVESGQEYLGHMTEEDSDTGISERKKSKVDRTTSSARHRFGVLCVESMNQFLKPVKVSRRYRSKQSMTTHSPSSVVTSSMVVSYV